MFTVKYKLDGTLDTQGKARLTMKYKLFSCGKVNTVGAFLSVAVNKEWPLSI